MKVLYCGVYRDGTGWSQAATDYILALDTVGVDVVARPIKLNNNQPKIHPRLEELEAKSSKGCDVVIQHILPHMMDYNGHFKKNIGLFVMETDSLLGTNWVDKLKTMDEVWCPNREQERIVVAEGVNKPTKTVPHTCNVAKFNKEYEPLPLPHIKDRFVFYTIGEWVKRKNIESIIKAFHLEFSVGEPVELVIKTNIPGANNEQASQHLVETCNNIRKELKIHNDHKYFKPETIICQHLTDDQICSLHKACHCFINASRGEAWCQPAFDALGFGNPVITTEFLGPADYINEYNGYIVKHRMAPCYGATDTLAELQTGEQSWAELNLRHLQMQMREAYSDWVVNGGVSPKSQMAKQTARMYDYKVVGGLMKRMLEQ